MGRVGHVSLLGRHALFNSLFATDSDSKSKKRKAEEPPPGAKGVPTAKKPSPVIVASQGTKLPPAKKPSSKPSDVKGAKSDSSFFSAPKPKPKLPDFKKAPVVVKKEHDPNVAQPSSYDPFAEIVKSLKPRKDSPMAVATPPPAGQVTGSQGPATKSGKKKTVKWAPDGQLELVKLIERAVYDDDPADVSSLLFESTMYCKLTLVRVLCRLAHRVYTLRTVSANLTEAKVLH